MATKNQTQQTLEYCAHLSGVLAALSDRLTRMEQRLDVIASAEAMQKAMIGTANPPSPLQQAAANAQEAPTPGLDLFQP